MCNELLKIVSFFPGMNTGFILKGVGLRTMEKGIKRAQ